MPARLPGLVTAKYRLIDTNSLGSGHRVKVVGFRVKSLGCRVQSIELGFRFSIEFT